MVHMITSAGVISATGLSHIETKLANRMPQVLHDNNVATLQTDRQALCETLASELATDTSMFTDFTAAVIERGHIPLQALMLAGMGVQAVDMIGTYNPWPMMLMGKTPGCFYENGNGQIASVGLESYERDSMSANYMASHEYGTVCNVEGRLKTAVPDQMSGAVIDCGNIVEVLFSTRFILQISSKHTSRLH